ncbi:ABC transporter substrate-binding protein [Paludibacterium paludis]|uniref:Iron ABC transporter substrate-binding protein n=1 Tax=Paludibacterium paludis TaxID=1225769 RepID=A0A918UB16_9NEIS|nr:ABC transporter substrate-binding protein [Paludibacterium paludis]GGY20051.1 iron ABC transporter substrate-binding protein [Paludibacterium paludis]
MSKRLAAACAAIMLLTGTRSALAANVVLYSSNDVQTVNSVVEQFEKENPGIKVSVVRAGTGALMQRIKAEAANPLGDIFWSGGLSTIGAYQTHLQPYKSPEENAVPAHYREPNGLWLATNTHVTVLMVNQKQLQGNPAPKGWADLAAPRWKGKIVIPDPAFSSASYVALYGLKQTLGSDVFAGVVRNAVIVGTTSAAYQGVANGEFPVAVTMEYAAQQYVAGGLGEIRLVYPSEGTFLSPEGMAMIKGAKHPAEARKLFDFLASRKIQTEIFRKAFRRPLRTDIQVGTLSSLPPLSAIKIVPLNDERMENDRADFLAQWRKLVSAR